MIVKKLDLASRQSVPQCAKEILASEERLGVLINNAGVMSCLKWQTEDGFEMQIGVNHLGHSLLCLLDLLKKSSPSRIVNVASLVRERGAAFSHLNRCGFFVSSGNAILSMSFNIKNHICE